MTLAAKTPKLPIGWQFSAKEKTPIMKKVKNFIDEEWRSEVLHCVTGHIIDFISKLDDGCERSLVSLVNDIYFNQGYAWIYSDSMGQFMLTRDVGSNFLLTDGDLQDILEMVMTECRNCGIFWENTRKSGLCYTDLYKIRKAV